jgi:hypothetical protein
LRWLYQFKRRDRKLLRKLLDHVVYYSEANVSKALVRINKNLLERLHTSGVQEENVIYVQVHEAGSSSPVMLNMLRDRALLQKGRYIFLDSKDHLGLYKNTRQLGDGAIIYVDDFSGTGDQFVETRSFMAQSIIGNFAEFFLAPCICEEAYSIMEAQGITPFCDRLHLRKERPLLKDCDSLPHVSRERLIEITKNIDSIGGMGYRELATMVVIYLNSPDTVPCILRGSPDQYPFAGIFPRTTDLPEKKK